MIPHNKPTLDQNELNAVDKVLMSNHLVYGNNIQKFEDEMCDFVGLPHGHAVCVSSGSSALLIALHVLELKHKNVAIPSYACSSIKNACLLNQSFPIYLDNQQGKPIVHITENDKNKLDGLIYPYLYGFSSTLPSIEGKPIIEDIAQSLGASNNNQMLSTIGNIGILSFYATKMITSGGQGGMLISRDKTFIQAAKDFILFDQKIDNNLHFNLHMTEIQAAIGRVQLKKLPEFIKKREDIWNIYNDEGLPLLDVQQLNLRHVRYRAIVLTPKQKELINTLKLNKVTAINPFTENELLSPHSTNALALTKQTVSLPIYPSLSIKQAKEIADITLKALDSV